MKSRYKQKRSGFSLLEVMLATVCIAIIATGAMSFSFHSSKRIHREKMHRSAIVLAKERMEIIRSFPTDSFRVRQDNITIDSDPVYLRLVGNDNGWSLARSASDPGEAIQVNEKPNGQIISRVWFVDAPAPTQRIQSLRLPTFLEIEVIVFYGPEPRDFVYLRSYHTG